MNVGRLEMFVALYLVEVKVLQIIWNWAPVSGSPKRMNMIWWREQ